MAIHDYKADLSFEARTRCFHYPFLVDRFSRDGSRAFVREVTDETPEGKAEQLQGIDVYLDSMDGGSLPVELKTDRHVDLPNVFLEIVSNSTTGTCYKHAEALDKKTGFKDVPIEWED